MFPRTDNPRPPLPDNLNPNLAQFAQELPPVKFQPISRDSRTVLVGRVKIATPNGHAYVLRRYDTGCISLTTMWRAAFPGASATMEKDEINWVKENFPFSLDSSEKLRLAGTWLPVNIAQHLAPSYSLSVVLAALARAHPDETAIQRGARTSEAAATPTHPTQTPNGPNKRRKELHVQQETPSSSSPGPLTLPSRQTKSPAPPTRNTPSRVAKGKKAVSPPPAYTTIPTQLPPISFSPTKPASTKRTRSVLAAAAAAAAAANDSDMEELEIPGADVATDIAEQQALVQQLKAEKENEQQLLQPTRVSPRKRTPAQSTHSSSSRTAPKRTREQADAPLQFDLKEPAEDDVSPEERAISTNSRVVRKWPMLPSIPSVQLHPNQKSAAWGTLAFAIGLGATVVLPQFF